MSIKCAPVIAIVDQSCFGEEAAHRWARAVLGETARLDYLRTFEQVRFRRDGPDGMPAAFALLWPAGCLELITPIEHSLDDQQRPTIAVAEIASEVVRFATTIRERAHSAIYGEPDEDLQLVDWWIGVSPAISRNQYTPWSALTFPGRRPADRASSQGPPFDPLGFGHENLTGVRFDLLPAEVAMVAIADFIVQAGYIGRDNSIEDLRRWIASDPEET